VPRFSDRWREGHSSICPFVADELPSQRHSRRLKVALEHEREARTAVEALGGELSVSNGGHHWTFAVEGYPTVEWWPSTAKCVVGKRWSNATHAHDHEQVLAVVRRVVESRRVRRAERKT
jgi:hypothetical protein